MKKVIKDYQSGFTLIEMLIVVVILAIVVGMTSDMLMSLIRSNTKTQVINEIEQQANFVSLKIEKELRDADLVSTSYDSDCLENLCLKFRRRDGKNVTYNLVPLPGTSPVAYKLQRSLEGLSGGAFLDVTNTSSIGGVHILCAGGSGKCFEIIGTSPQTVKINMIFNQAQQSAGRTYKGSIKIESSIVIRSTY